jgi:hypothetical protein
MVVVNLITGKGWEVLSGVLEEGPGELGGEQPLAFSHCDTIHALTGSGIYNRWTREGHLVASYRYPRSWITPGEAWQPVGFAGGHAVVMYTELPAREAGEQALSQGLRIYDDRGLLADVAEPIPDLSMRMTEAGFRSGSGRLLASARGHTIVQGLLRRSHLTTYDADGAVLAARDLGHEVLDAFVDADERIWVRVLARDEEGTIGNIVLDRNLRELFRVAASRVLDASGTSMLAIQPGQTEVLELVLLKMRGATADLKQGVAPSCGSS